jgi:flavin-binding protein dodecin
VAVQKAVELTGTGGTVEEAVQEALDRAESTLEGITSFEVREIGGAVENGRTVYRVELRVWFTLLERLHG